MAMFKDVKVSYPKKRKKIDELTIKEIQEPVRRTLYDVIQSNFQRLQRVTYVHRIIYAGEHSFVDNSSLESLMRTNITTVNDGYTAEKLTGFLLVYANTFIHMLEGDEDSIHKHLNLLLRNDARATRLGTLKLLIQASHIGRRIIDYWNAYFGSPGQYLGKINIDCSYDESARYVYNCIRKMYHLIFAYSQNDDMSKDPSELSTSVADHQVVDQRSSDSANMAAKIKSDMYSVLSLRATGPHLAPVDPYRNTLPEYEIVDFTIKSEFTTDLEKYSALYGKVPQKHVYNDRVWPCSSPYVPYDVFDIPYENITELPRTGREEARSKHEFLDESMEVMEEATTKI